MTEKEILDDLDKVGHELIANRALIKSLKLQLIEAESVLIENQLRNRMLQEQLRVLRNRTVGDTPDARDLEIAAFKEKLPELMSQLDKKG